MLATLSPTVSTQGSLKAIPYDEVQAGKPPIPITVAPPPPASARLGIHPLMRSRTSLDPSPNDSTDQSKLHHNVRRDSGLAPSNSTARESRTTLATDESVASLKTSPTLPGGNSLDGHVQSSLNRIRKWSGRKDGKTEPQEEVAKATSTQFMGIMTNIPTSSFEDLTSPGRIEFSKRGSILIGGKRANETNGKPGHRARTSEVRHLPTITTPTPPATDLPARYLSMDDEILSQNVRSLYKKGMDQEGSDLKIKNDEIEEEPISTGITSGTPSQSDNTRLPIPDESAVARASSATTLDSRLESTVRHEGYELAGGIEDWEDVNGGDVDRYGFIVPQHVIPANPSSPSVRLQLPEPPRLQRMSTSLQVASEAPRRQRSKLGRNPSLNSSARSVTSPLPIQKPLRRSTRPPSAQGSYQSSISRPNSRMRFATNRLLHNRDRRCLDEAGDMLTLPPGLVDIAEKEGSRQEDEMKRREWEREDKWRKMAKQTKPNRHGGGMVFEFDTSSPKLISRTWKGIPDRWRATAWHAFLTASANKRAGSASDEVLISTFHELIDRSSPDDVQIDIDVPRTINSHIMFRKRYRGGQRLLFRVLHCLSIYFPETGYVQGMAALTATMLCYFDEEMTFVMLVRMWQLRGIARLYQSGFEGLIEALDELDKNWLNGGEVAAKLVSCSPPAVLNEC